MLITILKAYQCPGSAGLGGSDFPLSLASSINRDLERWEINDDHRLLQPGRDNVALYMLILAHLSCGTDFMFWPGR